MKLVIAGKSFAACKALLHSIDLLSLVNFDFQLIVLPVISDKGQHDWQPSLRNTAEKFMIKIVEDIDNLNLSQSDVFISIEYDKVIKPTALKGANCFNIHFSNLPKYRGCLTSVWPIREGEKITGVTLHVITRGIDDGPIVDQLLFEIPSFYSSYDLYLHYNAYAFELFKKNILTLLLGTFTLSSQDNKTATYYKRSSVNFNDLEITDFTKPCSQVSDYIRSLIFKPYQLPVFNEKHIISCIDLNLPKRPEHRVAQLVIESNYHAVVCCTDGYVRLEFLNDFYPFI